MRLQPKKFAREDDDRVCTAYAVRADLALVRQYGISLQELPMVCRGILEQRLFTGDEEHTFTYTEAEMRIHADARLEAEKLKIERKPPKLDTVM